MNEVQKYEWGMMVQSAELSLKSNCPLPEDEVIVEADRRITELKKELLNSRALGGDVIYITKSELAIRDLEQQAKGVEDSRKYNVQKHREYGSDWLKGNVIGSMQIREKELRSQAKELEKGE